MSQFTVTLTDSFGTPINIGDKVEYTYEWEYEEPCGSVGYAQSTNTGVFSWDQIGLAFCIEAYNGAGRRYISQSSTLSFRKV